jgi:osmotically-inducible protein OsmY
MFRLNPRLRAVQPMVYVRDGVVTLAGPVSNLRAKLNAAADAQNVVGVARVHDFLKVCPSRPVSDQEVEQAVASALARSTHVGHLGIKVQAAEGTVRLTGRDGHR